MAVQNTCLDGEADMRESMLDSIEVNDLRNSKH
jgi:tubulin polyglutamylase TTLL5